jgi:hypothetical protein
MLCVFIYLLSRKLYLLVVSDDYSTSESGVAKAVYSDLSLAEKARKTYNKKHREDDCMAYIVELIEDKDGED